MANLSDLSNDFVQYRKSFLSDKSSDTKILPLEVDLIYLFIGSKQIKNVNCVTKCEYCSKGCEVCDFKGERFNNFNTQIFIDKGSKEGDLIPFLDNCRHPYKYFFKIKEINTTPFQRKGHNLYYVCNISLKDAIGNCLIEFPFVDNTSISYQSNELIKPTSIKVIKGKGMPVRYRSGIYGDLIINYNIIFPQNLSLENRLSISKCLPNDSSSVNNIEESETISDTELNIEVEESSSISDTNNEQCSIM